MHDGCVPIAQNINQRFHCIITIVLQSVESGKVVLDGGYIDLDPAKLASMTTTVSTSTVSDPTRDILCQ